jgi:2-polyprenyl-3-methyl-5-hydroxy-6-metoxy-1,4-benzoquinol methylase
VFSGFLEDSGLPQGSFDYIYMGDVIEHVSDPLALMRQVKGLLKPEGKIIVLTPNLDCLWSKMTFKLFRWFGIPWSSLTPPHHLFQFSTSNLDRLISKTGLTISSRSYAHPPRLAYELGSLHLFKIAKNKRTLSSWLFYVFLLCVILCILCGVLCVQTIPIKR